MALDKLKVAARQHEQREEWRAAIELYRQAIRASEEASEGVDPYLYSRIGDLEQKAGNHSAACEAWEQAASRYGDLGFANNAIAICTKILRTDPTRSRSHLELARFQARKGMYHDAERNLKLYLETMQSRGQEELAHEGLLSLGEEFSDWDLLRELLGNEPDTGREHRPSPASRDNEGPAPGLVFIDTGPLTLERASEAEADLHEASRNSDDLALEPRAQPLDTIIEPAAAEPPVDPAPLPGLISTINADQVEQPGSRLDGLEFNSVEGVEADASVTRVQGLEGQSIAADASIARVQGLEGHGIEDDAAEPAQSDETAELTDHLTSMPEAPGDPDPTAATSDASITPPLVFLEPGDTGVPLNPPQALPLDEPVQMPDPAADDPLGQRAAAHAWLEIGDRARGIAAFEQALQLYQQRSEWLPAWQTASELVVAEPNHIGHHQTRVEIATHLSDLLRLADAYLDLGDALVRTGANEKAVAVYRRVLEIDEASQRAREALNSLGSRSSEGEATEGFVDLRSMIVDDGPRTTRMRTETTRVSSDEDETFQEALAEFKRALNENLPAEDSQAQYDLGVAFREMGLLDEAVSCFQKALRSPEGRLRTSEALGQTFFDQGRVAVAEAVLRNAENGPEAEDAKIGVLYWLGRTLEVQQRRNDALACYQRVLAVDVFFMDVGERIRQLQGESE